MWRVPSCTSSVCVCAAAGVCPVVRPLCVCVLPLACAQLYVLCVCGAAGVCPVVRPLCVWCRWCVASCTSSVCGVPLVCGHLYVLCVCGAGGVWPSAVACRGVWVTGGLSSSTALAFHQPSRGHGDPSGGRVLTLSKPPTGRRRPPSRGGAETPTDDDPLDPPSWPASHAGNAVPPPTGVRFADR